MSKNERLAYLRKNAGKATTTELSEKLGVSVRTIQRNLKELGITAYQPPSVDDKVQEFRSKHDLKREKRSNRDLVKRVAELEEELEASLSLSKHDGYYKIPHPEGEESEAVAVIVASDWHVAEVVHNWQTSNLNEFNEEVCRTRVRRFFQHGLKLVKQQQAHTKIKTLILALLGDLINGHLRDEDLESNRLLPVHEVIETQEHIASGIRYLLENSDLDIVIPCHMGNHGRMTKRVHVGTEAGNSLERLLYHSLAKQFEGEERVTFLISDGYHSYVKVWPEFTIRFHHGHQCKYYGGSGGLTIPLNKAIAGWNKGRRADLDVLGHFHQLFDGGNFIVNGSLVGYNAYALSIKASPEEPKQAFFLIDKECGKTLVAPIILDRDR